MLEINGNPEVQCPTLGVEFFSVEDVVRMTNWSEKTIQKLFNDPKFPSADFGRNKLVEKNALIEFFSRKHEKSKDKYWRTK